MPTHVAADAGEAVGRRGVLPNTLPACPPPAELPKPIVGRLGSHRHSHGRQPRTGVVGHRGRPPSPPAGASREGITPPAAKAAHSRSQRVGFPCLPASLQQPFRTSTRGRRPREAVRENSLQPRRLPRRFPPPAYRAHTRGTARPPPRTAPGSGSTGGEAASEPAPAS